MKANKADLKQEPDVSDDFKGKCPHVKDPFANCYCTSLRSTNVAKMIYFCGGKYEECEIYNKEHKKDENK
ncbi:MAG: hypothetical protein IME96_06990 [Proteobacteria bacterium]|nr:hypothetical protein [Pseudomonadota bacterium]